MSHILALQVDHFSMQNLDQFSVQLNSRGFVADYVSLSVCVVF
jgi:hypothetical protein